jgi:hypothetical protein
MNGHAAAGESVELIELWDGVHDVIVQRDKTVKWRLEQMGKVADRWDEQRRGVSHLGRVFTMPFSGAAFRDIGGGVSDLFAAEADRAKAKGDLAEAQEYGLAAAYADKEALYTRTSTQIQEYQQQRALSKSLGDTSAGIAGAGFAAGGSGLDMLRESASQARFSRR